MNDELLQQVIPYTDIALSRLLFAIAVLFLGFVLSKLLVNFFKKGMRKTELPDLTIQFLSHFLTILFYVIIIFAFLKSLSFDVDSFIVGISAVVGLVLGLGMQDTLTNIAAGVWVAAVRPIDMGETVSVSGQTGKVRAVGIMSTELLTPDNQLITIPNKLVWGNSIVNMTRMSTRRVTVEVGISYSSDLKKAMEIALDLMKKNLLILQEPEPSVITTELAASSINLQLAAWTKTGDFGKVKDALTIGIFEAYIREGIEIPFAQLDVHIKEFETKEIEKKAPEQNTG
ncbi:MAG TPA: mechanosensitive ion channel family protein [Methanosarcina sp.]|nr:mechanosensitive ion channel family protein [Methanosarcina sp.]